MDHPGKRTRAGPPPGDLRSGLGVPCTEAQADGVPCAELGINCGDCDRAKPSSVVDRLSLARGLPFEIADA